ncbi:MAG: peptidoglycan-associated lipoprotein [Granulosicoccus sp.]|jgi:peptidoglycan-associated lipoprotein
MLKTPLFTMLLATSLISACGTAPTRDSSTQNIVPIKDNSTVVLPVTIDGVQGFENVDPSSVAGRAPLDRVIYFDYDKSELRAEFLDIVAQHGRFLAQNPAGRVRLEGHTDERGTREYNIALGEARAKTIARMLQLQGVGEAQSRTVSYGEELPVDEAHNNDAWAKNRRVNVIYESEIQN